MKIKSKNIYFIHSSAFDFKNEYYKPIQESQLSELYNLIFPHALSDRPFASRSLFESGKCGLAVAEISFPSTGSGIEIGWANAFDIPIIMIAREDAKVHDSILTLSSSFFRYKDQKDMIAKLIEAIKGV